MARRRPEELSLDRVLSVELIPGTVGELQPLPPQPYSSARVEPLLDGSGDFLAKGLITSLVWLDDEPEDAMLEVMVGPALFSLPAELARVGGLEWGG